MEIRVGVFVCDCGTNIGGVVDVSDVVEYAKTLSDVVFADEGRWICSVDYLNKIKEYVKEHDLNRVVVACCTPRTHEPTFKSTVKEAGLNPYLLEFVSIREQSSWVHKSDPKKATEKAKDLVRMGVAKARLLEPAEETRVSVGKDCVVIGGGISGMTSALALADSGFDVKLIEKNNEIGGILCQADKIAPFEAQASEIVADRKKQIEERNNIEVYTGSEIQDVKGYVGNYKVMIEKEGEKNEHDVSTIIVATGMRELEPEGQFQYKKSPNVVTQLQLENMLKSQDLKDLKEVAIINCVNSRNDMRGCCNVGCLISIKNAKALKEKNENAKIYLFYRDLNIRGPEVPYFKEIIEKYDIKLVRISEDKMPEVFEDDGRLALKTHDILLGRELTFNPDLIVLTTAFQGDATVEKLKGLLKVSANDDGFFQEAHIKLRPLDFASDGIYLGGCARSPKSARESIEEAMGAAMRAAIPMKRGYVEAEGIVADIDYEKCNECGLCAKNCAFGAIELMDKRPEVIKAICKGCGTCAAECPKDAIDIIHFTEEQILAQVEAALEEEPQDKILAFCCHWCALGAVDMAGVGRSEYPFNIRIIRVMCVGRVDKSFIMKAYELGAGGILVAGCEFPTCHYITGNYKCKDRIEKLKKKLEKDGKDTDKLWIVWLSAADGPKFVKTVKDMVDNLNL
ncbi:MAG: hydrogenase iron-sulfur subunit [Methanomassiliicoccales archaeon]|nr:MAG: hydrogenase iron-sulfur subunit [Methanomassiliicoccales archaeon]